MTSIVELRRIYHQQLGQRIIRLRKKDSGLWPNFSDSSSATSRDIASKILENLGLEAAGQGRISGQKAGSLFETITKDFLEQAFSLLYHLRPGQWRYSTASSIAEFDQYAHLAALKKIINQKDELKAALGTDYIIQPDIVISRVPVSEEEINQNQIIIASTDHVAKFTPLRAANTSSPKPILHASISCKWTVRSDRAQNTRTEGLNLIRNRKGNLPHVMIVTAEPMPTRLASLALGTGDVDCVYHFALNELQAALVALNNEDQLDMLATLVNGRRLRDISDLPFDLAI
jgi:hypothetical protein